MVHIKCEKKSDKQLVKLALKNADYYRCIMEKYEKALSRYIRHITNADNASIEDILQEIFIKVYKNLEDYDDAFPFSSWLYRIAHNEAINFFRKAKSRPQIAEPKNEDEMDYLEVIPSAIDLHGDYIKKELASKVHLIINSLPEKYREVLILKFIEDKSYEEISDILKKPQGTVATLINRAKEQFKQLAGRYDLK